MNIFPIGTIAAATSAGTIDGVNYNMFEPNSKARSFEKHTILVSPFQMQINLSRKKADPYLIIEYEYNNIFSREYRQIEHFVYKMEDALTSFYVVDWSKGITPSSVVNSSGDWLVSITNTRLFSTVTNQKANRALLWDGLNWKEGPVVTVTANTSIAVDVDTSNYGGLILATANTYGMVYPLYECHFSPDALSSFTTGAYIPESANLSGDGGFVWTGSTSFSSKYKV